MKTLLQKLMTYYNTNAKFQSFVSGLEGCTVSALTGWIVTMGYGLPVTRQAWTAMGFFVGKAVYGWAKRWLQQNMATVGVATTAGDTPVKLK